MTYVTDQYRGRRRTILAVDDSPEDLDVIRSILVPEYTVKRAASGSMALKIAETQPPDLILLDVMMPDMNGYDVCRRLKGSKATQDIPVIFVTAKDQTEDELQGLDLGAIDYIAKPLRTPVLRSRIRNHLALADAIKQQRLANERHRLLIDTSPDAILICSVERVMFINEAAKRLCIDPRVELMGREFATLFTSRHVPHVGTLIEGVISGTRQSGAIDAQMRTRDGLLIDVEIVALAIDHEGGRAAEVIVHDLSARRDADHFRTMTAVVFNGSAEAMIVTDAETRVQLVNAAFTEITGYLPEEVIGQTPRILSSGRHPPEFYEGMWQAILTKGRWIGDVWNRRKNGDVYAQPSPHFRPPQRFQ
ncbi:MAG: response regulator [Alphaproteobacteria bacterium]